MGPGTLETKTTNGLSYFGFKSILFGNQEARPRMELWGSFHVMHWPSHPPSSNEQLQRAQGERRWKRPGAVFNSKGSEMWITLSLSLDMALLCLNML